MVSSVSSMVLLVSVLSELLKKCSAASSVSPLRVSVRCVSALYRNLDVTRTSSCYNQK